MYLPIALSKVFDIYRDKDKQTQALPLKEDFRQVPGQVTGQVFQTTWRKEILPQCKLLIQAKQSKKFTKELSN